MANSESKTRKPSDSAAPLAAAKRRVDITERTFAFAVRVVKLARALPSDTVGFVLGRQLLRSATSVGANVEEAQGSHSRAEFARRMNIARSESREALYWLRLVEADGVLPKARMSAIVAEAEEIVRILVAIVKRTRTSDRE
ncbi:MAG: four helix bundle protein [Phycisphaerae bacterium]|nr:four helix bundle protein [Phycisphaerae bacterium]